MSGAGDAPNTRGPRLALNFALLSSGEAASKILAAVSFAYLARVLGPAGFGDLEFALALVVVLTLVVDSGLSAFGAREVAKDQHALPRLATHILVARSTLAVAAVGLLALSAYFLDKPPEVKQLLLLYGLTLLATAGLAPWAFQGRDLMHWVAAANAVRWSFFGIGVLVFVHSAERLWMVPVIETVAILVAASLYLTRLLPSIGSQNLQFDPGYLGSIVRQALPIGVAEVVWAGKIYFATLLLGLWLWSSEVGWFGAAHRLVIALHAFVWLYFFNLLPSLSRTSNMPTDAFHRLIGTSLQLTLWAGLFLGIVGSAFAEPVIRLVYGNSYQEAVTVFQILIWLVPLALFSGNFRYSLIAYGKQRLELLAAAAGAVLNVALCVVLIPRLGLQGAALAMVASELLILGLASHFTNRTVAQVPTWRHLWRPLIAGVCLIATVVAMSGASVVLAGAAVIAVYVIAAALLQPRILGYAQSALVRGSA